MLVTPEKITQRMGSARERRQQPKKAAQPPANKAGRNGATQDHHSVQIRIPVSFAVA